jgi:hypothetical protein
MTTSAEITRAVALLDELQRRARALGYNGPIVTARGGVHPDVERLLEAHRVAVRDTGPRRSDLARGVR